MEFSWNKWRQYIIQEAAVNEADEFDIIGEITPFFEDAASMGIIDDRSAQIVMDAAGNSEDLAAFVSTLEFQQIGKKIIMAAVDALEKGGRETHYLHQRFGQEASNPIEGADISNAVNILKKSQDQAVEEVEQDTIDMAVQNIDSPHGPSLEEDKFDNPGWDLKVIMSAFKEYFEEATRDTDDIVYAQERVIAAFKDKFAETHPKLSREIDMYLNNKDAETRKMFQNVADDPEVVGRDMMSEGPIVATFNVGDRAKLIVDPKLGVNQPGEELKVIRVEPQIGGKFFNVQVQNSKGEKAEYDNKQLALVGLGPKSREEEGDFGGYPLGELEGEVQSEAIPDVNTDFSVDTDFSSQMENDKVLDEVINSSVLDKMIDMHEPEMSGELLDALEELRQEFLEKERK